MRKKSQDELGTLVTREMKVMLQDESLTKEQRFDILSCVMFDAPLKNTLMASFANSLKAGFDKINATKIKAVMAHREAAKLFAAQARASKKKLQRLLDAGYIDVEGEIIDINNKELPTIDINGNQLSTTSRQRQRQSNNISPYKPPKGGKRKVPKAVEPEDILKGGRSARRPTMHDGKDGVRTATLEEMTASLAASIESTEAFAHMRVNRRNLMRHLLPIVKKNCAAKDGSNEQRLQFGELYVSIFDGLEAWTEKWKADGWQYAPGKITKWLADEKWLEEPRKKTAPAEGSGCGDCGAEIA